MSTRNTRAGVGNARVSRAMGVADPRLGRNARAATSARLTIGAGLDYDREGKLRVRAGPSVPPLPLAPTLADLQAWAAAIDRSLRTAGLIPR